MVRLAQVDVGGIKLDFFHKSCHKLACNRGYDEQSMLLVFALRLLPVLDPDASSQG